MTKSDLMTLVKSKLTWNSKDLNHILNQKYTEIIPLLLEDNKKVKVDILKKYDICFVPTMGFIHYVLILKVDTEISHGLVLSSKEDIHNLYQFKYDRFFKDFFVTNSLLTFSTEECKKNYVRRLETIKEARHIVKLYKNYLLQQINMF